VLAVLAQWITIAFAAALTILGVGTQNEAGLLLLGIVITALTLFDSWSARTSAKTESLRLGLLVVLVALAFHTGQIRQIRLTEQEDVLLTKFADLAARAEASLQASCDVAKIDGYHAVYVGQQQVSETRPGVPITVEFRFLVTGNRGWYRDAQALQTGERRVVLYLTDWRAGPGDPRVAMRMGPQAMLVDINAPNVQPCQIAAFDAHLSSPPIPGRYTLQGQLSIFDGGLVDTQPVSVQLTVSP
jgi:hypothetical protein